MRAKSLTCPESLRRYYQEHGLSERQAQGLKAHAFKKGQEPHNKVRPPKNLFEKLYKDLRMDEIARLLGVVPVTVCRWRQFYNIAKKNRSEIIKAAWDTRGRNKIKKVCPQCNKEFEVKLSLARVICCSISCAKKYQWRQPEYRNRLEALHKEMYKNNPELLRRVLTSRKPNNSEAILINLFKEYNLPYRYVGDGEVILGGCNPDFINIDGKKEIIELFGAHWHDLFDIARKVEHYRTYGFKTLIIWEDELKDLNKALRKIKKFTAVRKELN